MSTNVDRASTVARGAARKAGDHPVIEWGARLGYAASGVLHLVLAWITAQVAPPWARFTRSGGNAGRTVVPGGWLADVELEGAPAVVVSAPPGEAAQAPTTTATANRRVRRAT